MHPCRLRLLIVALFLPFAAAPTLRADVLSQLFRRDVDVISVTDMTESGKAVQPPAPGKPVRFMLVYLGEIDFGRDWAGEKLPTKKQAIGWMLEALKNQGFLLADEAHPPEQIFVYGWGMLEGGSARPALKFLGGDKVELMWEQIQYGGFVDPKVLRRGMIRVGIAGKVWDVAESDLFLGIVRAYTPESLQEGARMDLLWETRFACPATGLAFDKAMPLLVRAAATNFGRETDKPVSLNATEAFGGRVELGELKILGEAEAPGQAAPAGESPQK